MALNETIQAVTQTQTPDFLNQIWGLLKQVIVGIKTVIIFLVQGIGGLFGVSISPIISVLIASLILGYIWNRRSFTTPFMRSGLLGLLWKTGLIFVILWFIN